MLPADITLPRVSHTLPGPKTLAPKAPLYSDHGFDLRKALRDLAADPIAQQLMPDPPTGKIEVKVSDGQCHWCGERYEPRDPKQKYCTHKCYIAAQCARIRDKNREARGTTLRAVICPICGTGFETMHPKQLYCTAGCRSVAKAIQNKERERLRKETGAKI